MLSQWLCLFSLSSLHGWTTWLLDASQMELHDKLISLDVDDALSVEENSKIQSKNHFKLGWNGGERNGHSKPEKEKSPTRIGKIYSLCGKYQAQ